MVFHLRTAAVVEKSVKEGQRDFQTEAQLAGQVPEETLRTRLKESD